MNVTTNPALIPTPFPGIQHATLAGSAQGLKTLSVWQQIIQAGCATPPHRHDCEEVVLCSGGRGELRLGNTRKQAFGANQTLCIPRNALHQIVNTGDEPLAIVALFSRSPVEVCLPDGEPILLPWSS